MVGHNHDLVGNTFFPIKLTQATVEPLCLTYML